MNDALEYNGLLCKKKVWEEARRAIMVVSQGVEDDHINELLTLINDLINWCNEEIESMENGKFEVCI